MDDLLLEEKERGNAMFKAGDYEQALMFYSSALKGAKQVSNIMMAVTLLCNKAAVLLKMENYQRCIEECNEALQLQPDAIKALYRRAQAYKATKDLASAYKDLAFLLKLQPTNAEAIALMRITREAFSQSGTGTTEVGLILAAMMKERTKTNDSSSNSSSSDGFRDEKVQNSIEPCGDHPQRNVLEEGMKSLISLCSEEKLHAMDFARRAGTKFIAELILQQLNSSSNSSNARTDHLVELAVQLLAACCTHSVFVSACVSAGGADNVWSPSHQTHKTDTSAALIILDRELIINQDDDRSNVEGKSSSSQPSTNGRTAYCRLSFEGLCLLSTVLVSSNTYNHNIVGSITNLPVITVALLMRILKSFPLSHCDPTPTPPILHNNDTVKPSAIPSLNFTLPFLTETSARCFLHGLFAMLKDVLTLSNDHNHDHINAQTTPSSMSKISTKAMVISTMSIITVIDRLTIVTDALSVRYNQLKSIFLINTFP